MPYPMRPPMLPPGAAPMGGPMRPPMPPAAPPGMGAAPFQPPMQPGPGGTPEDPTGSENRAQLARETLIAMLRQKPQTPGGSSTTPQPFVPPVAPGSTSRRPL